jgi:hypothetical protein
MPGIDANKAVKEAQSVLNKSMKVPGEQQFAPKAPTAPAAPKPKASSALVSYSPAKTIKGVADAFKNPTGGQIASSLQYNNQNISDYVKALKPPKMHKGGKVPKDGVYEMKAGETVRTPEQEKKMQDHIKKASDAAQMMSKDDKKTAEKKPAEKKEHKEKKDGKKKHAHKVEVEKKKGGYLVKTHTQPEEGQQQEGPEESVHPDMASVNNHLNDVMGPDEAQAAPQGGAPAAAPMPTPGV